MRGTHITSCWPTMQPWHTTARTNDDFAQGTLRHLRRYLCRQAPQTHAERAIVAPPLLQVVRGTNLVHGGCTKQNGRLGLLRATFLAATCPFRMVSACAMHHPHRVGVHGHSRQRYEKLPLCKVQATQSPWRGQPWTGRSLSTWTDQARRPRKYCCCAPSTGQTCPIHQNCPIDRIDVYVYCISKRSHCVAARMQPAYLYPVCVYRQHTDSEC